MKKYSRIYQDKFSKISFFRKLNWKTGWLILYESKKKIAEFVKRKLYRDADL